MIAGVLVLASTAAVAGPPGTEVEDDVSLSAGGSVDTTGSVAANAGGTGRIIGPHGETAASVGVAVDVERSPGLGAPRELLAGPYTGVSGDAFADARMNGDFPTDKIWSWPVEIWGSAIVQDGEPRFVLGMEHHVFRGCKYGDYGAEPACITAVRARVSVIYDQLRRYETFSFFPAAVTGLALGPVRADLAFGGGAADRGLRATPDIDELSVSGFIWDVRARTRAAGVDLAVGSRREPFAAPDGTMSFEDRVEATLGYGERTRLTLSGYAARTRWWTDASTMRSADIVGGELAVSGRIAGFDVLVRAAVGRSYYSTLDTALHDRPVLGARLTLDVGRTVTVYRARRPAGS